MKIIKDNGRLCLMGTVCEEEYIYPKISEDDFNLLLKKPDLLKKIDIIGPGVFREYDLSNINFEETFSNIQIIDKYSFSKCKLQKNLIIPSKVRIIGAGAFSGCTNVENLTITSGTKFVGGSAFSHTPIETLVLEDDVAVIYDNAFEDCLNLKKIIADEMPYMFKNTLDKKVLINNGFVHDYSLEK